MLSLRPLFRRLTPLITVNGRAVYCAAVRRWPSRQARQVVYLMPSIYPAFVKGRKKISTRRNLSRCRAEPDQEALACRRYSRDTSCPAVLWCRRSRLWSQNISCPSCPLRFSDRLQFLRGQKALKAQIFIQPVPVNAARTQLKRCKLLCGGARQRGKVSQRDAQGASVAQLQPHVVGIKFCRLDGYAHHDLRLTVTNLR